MKRLGYSVSLVGLIGIIFGWGTCLHQPSSMQDMTSSNYIEPSDHFFNRITLGYVILGSSVLAICLGEYIRGIGKKKK
jgi:hypothetical protein